MCDRDLEEIWSETLAMAKHKRLCELCLDFIILVGKRHGFQAGE